VQRHSATAFLTLASLGVLAIALAFEHIGGYRACPLCLQQRYAYYFAIGAGVVAWAGWQWDRPGLARLLLGTIALAFLANAALGVYHAGAEWHWWPGPQSCAAGGAGPIAAGGLMQELEKSAVVRCDEAQWRLFGLSFAGWNVLVSLALAAFAALSARPRASH
jgi:disulfide bond formation protein DsbB